MSTPISQSNLKTLKLVLTFTVVIAYNAFMSFNHLHLNAAIAQSGMTKSKVAAALGVHLNTVSNWTNGHATPTLEKLVVLLQIIGWSEMQIRGSSLGEWYNVNGAVPTPARD